jgi:ubiquinone/menaquinone biosynthesis C-methylase UbiE
LIGWDHPDTAERYERYYRRHSRYRGANEVLIRQAALASGLRVLDVGAGTGRTATAALPALGPDGSILCVEPAAAMRTVGMHRLRDRRVTWRADLPPEAEGFDRILCGAAIWQLEPFHESIRRLAGLLRPGGALCFDIPALYLLEPDEPGGGHDPLLLDLLLHLTDQASASRVFRLEEDGRGARAGASAPATTWRYDAADIDSALRAAGLEPDAWEFRVRLTQTAYARWLTIPVLTDRIFDGIAAAERDRRIESALASVDRRSFKWERWRGWTAWKR